MIRTRLAFFRPLSLLLALCLGALVTLVPSSPAAFADGHDTDDADGPTAFPARFGAGAGPSQTADGTWRLLDDANTPRQSNAVAFACQHPGAHESTTLTCRLRVMKGGDGGSIAFLNTAEYGARGPAPHLTSVVEPDLRGTFAVGIDVHNPPNREPFGPWGNYQGLPQREVSLHWNGRELVKRVAPAEFRGDFVDCRIAIRHVCGGAEITVQLGEGTVYDRYFIAGLLPYEHRLALAAGTRADATTRFDVAGINVEVGETAGRRRPPVHVDVFNHVLTDNSTTSYRETVTLPPAGWAFGRVILTLQIHDAGPDWDEWDRCGHLYVIDKEGTRHDIVPFITSYRTECYWQVDVTHFRPWLAGETTLEIAAGTTFYKNRGYMMSVSLDFYHGTPALEPYRVIPLWHGTAHYRSAENHFRDFFEPQAVKIGEEVKAARVFVTTTGHSQVGEFTPSKRTFIFEPEQGCDPEQQVRVDDVLWKTDCYLNPNRPQSGTWKYSRAGWAPGDVVRPWWIDLTPHLQRGTTAGFRYQPHPYEFPEGRQPADAEIHKASHIVRAYLILYREAGQLVRAPILMVTNVQDGSAAATAGIRSGDYLVSYDGHRVDTIDDLRAALTGAANAGQETATVVVYRGSERLELEIATGTMGINLGTR